MCASLGHGPRCVCLLAARFSCAHMRTAAIFLKRQDSSHSLSAGGWGDMEFDESEPRDLPTHQAEPKAKTEVGHASGQPEPNEKTTTMDMDTDTAHTSSSVLPRARAHPFRKKKLGICCVACVMSALTVSSIRRICSDPRAGTRA